MSEFDALLDLIPIGDIAKKIGIDENIAELAVKAAVPALVGGLASNAQTSEGEKALEGALKKHKGKTPSTVDDIDTADGDKIVSHVFGSKKKEVTAAVADKSGSATQEIIAQVLPIIAPIVMAWVASQFLGKKETETASKAAESDSPLGSIGDMLGGFVGSKEGQDMIGGVLGGLFGGKK
ncbi:MAG: DUF937 domain-containing protein [Microbacteriaceae bacterium]